MRCTSFILTPYGWWLLHGVAFMLNNWRNKGIFIKSWLMFVYVFDRFFTVFMPFHYHNKVCGRVILILYSTVVIFSLFGSISPAALGCDGFYWTLSTCVNTPNFVCPQHEYCQMHLLAVTITGQLFGSYIPCIGYVHCSVYQIKAKKIRNYTTPQTDIKERAQQPKRDYRANIKFLTIFLSLFAVSFSSAWSFIALSTILLQPQKVTLPENFLIFIVISEFICPPTNSRFHCHHEEC